MKRLLLGILLMGLVACGNDSDRKMTLNLQPTPHALVDNLYVAKPRSGGGLASMGGAVGRFSLVGRCLIVDIDGTRHTPIFRGNVTLIRSGIATAVEEVPFDSEVRLPGIGPPVLISGVRGTRCPKEAVAIRSIGG